MVDDAGGRETLSPAEIRQLLAQSDGLALIRGRSIEVDHARLQRTLEQFQAIERVTKTGGLPFGEAMRLLAGAGVSSDASTEAAVADWSEVVAEIEAVIRVVTGYALLAAYEAFDIAGREDLKALVVERVNTLDLDPLVILGIGSNQGMERDAPNVATLMPSR